MAAAANMGGGLGLGPLIAGLFAGYVGPTGFLGVELQPDGGAWSADCPRARRGVGGITRPAAG